MGHFTAESQSTGWVNSRARAKSQCDRPLPPSSNHSMGSGLADHDPDVLGVTKEAPRQIGVHTRFTDDDADDDASRSSIVVVSDSVVVS